MYERHDEHDEPDEIPQPSPQPRPRRRLRTAILVIVGIIGLLVGTVAMISQQYHGPRNLNDVSGVMPGVPIFPYADVATGNPGTQRVLAIPLMLMRMQGVRTAEAVLLSVPAERDFVLDWYHRSTPFQQWTLAREEEIDQGTRFLYLRGNEAVQIIVGRTMKQDHTLIQMIYLSGLKAQQLQQLRGK